MEADRNLLFGVLALQGGLIDPGQFAEACTAWAARKEAPLADLLVERGWITPEDRAHVEYFLARRLAQHGGDAHASLLAATAGAETTRRALATIDDADIRRSLVAAPEPGPSPDAPAPVEQTGHVLLSTIAHTPETRERYTLSRLHAKGGIGQVWLARDGALGREVALKELRPERAGSPDLWARFLEEARITGQLEHPGIVPVYELSRRDGDEHPFYTMRFVRGRTLTEAAHAYRRRRAAGEAGPLDLQELLQAFVGVCNAVAYAHSRGVIHRDLKGQNVVLGDYGEVIVLDWGLAKVVGRDEATAAAESIVAPAPVTLEGDSHEATVAGQALGTPAYMAPEQAEGRIDQVDARSDVYGLGAILYEILTGRPPFVGDDVTDLIRRVVHEPPERPRTLNPAAPAALEAVCLKALAKRPEGRYASAKDLAREVRHFLADEPVTAYREPITVRLTRWGRRHRTAAASIGALLVTSVVALAIGTLLINRERARAEESFRQARAAVDDYFTTVSESTLLDVPGLQPLRKDLLDKALRYYQGFLDQRGDDPSVRAEAAATHYRVAWITQMIGSKEQALDSYRAALAMYEGLSRSRPDEARYRVDLAIVCNDLGNLYRALGRPDEAQRTHERSRVVREALARAHPEGARHQNELAKSYANLGDLAGERGEAAEALALYERARAINEAVLRAEPTTFDLPTDLGRAFNNAAEITLDLAIELEAMSYYQDHLDRDGEALESTRRALELLDGLVGDHPDKVEYRSRLAGSCNRLGYLLVRDGRLEEAEPYHQKALALIERLADENPQITNFQSQLAGTLNNLTRLRREQGRLDEARALCGRALEIQEALVDAHPEIVGYQSTLAYLDRSLGRLEAQSGRPAEALAAFRKAQAIDARHADRYPISRYDLACDLALCVPLVGREEREAVASEAITTLRRAIAAGYRHRELIRTDPDLDALRDRPDFRQLLDDLAGGTTVAAQ